MCDHSSHDNKQEENNLHLSVCVHLCVSVVCVHAAHVNTLVYVWPQQPWQQTGRKQFAFVCVCASLCVCGVCACSPCKHTGLCVTTAAMTTNKKKTICICLCVFLCVHFCESVVCVRAPHEDALKLRTYVHTCYLTDIELPVAGHSPAMNDDWLIQVSSFFSNLKHKIHEVIGSVRCTWEGTETVW